MPDDSVASCLQPGMMMAWVWGVASGCLLSCQGCWLQLHMMMGLHRPAAAGAAGAGAGAAAAAGTAAGAHGHGM